MRRGSTHNPPMNNLRDIQNKIQLHYCDMTDEIGLFKIIKETEPDELYHLAAQSDVKVSFEQPSYTVKVNALGTVHILDALHTLELDTRMYNAATSELYGKINRKFPLDEQSRFNPESPYGFSKQLAFYACRNYRNAYGMFISSGILFNHESPRRGENFVTRKITKTIAEKKELILGNINSVRDWGYAPEYVEAMWMMLQHKEPDDFVIATGETHSVGEFVDAAMEYAGYTVTVRLSDDLKRPVDVIHLRGDATKAKHILGWEPKIRFKELVKIMVDYDIQGTIQ